MPIGALSQSRTRASHFKECFLKINGRSFVLTNSWIDTYLELGGLATDFHREEVVLPPLMEASLRIGPIP